MTTGPEDPSQGQGHYVGQGDGTEEQSTPSPSASVPSYPSQSNNGPGGFQNGTNTNYSPNGSGYYEPTGPAAPHRNIVGIIALIVAVVGTILACIPGIMILGWPLLLIAFIMGIVAVCLAHKVKWQGIVAIVLSVVGAGMSLLVLLMVAAATMSDDETTSFSDSTAQESASESQDSPEGAGDSNFKNGEFGQTATWDDGLTLTVGEPEAFTPSDTAATPTGSYEYRKFTVTVHNGTKNPIDAGAINPAVQSGGKQGELVIDQEIGAMGGGSGKIQPGKDLTYVEAYGVADPSDISMDFRIYLDDGSFTEHEVTFTS